MGDAEISNGFRIKLTKNLDNHHSALSNTLQTFNERQNHYTNSMQAPLDQVEFYRQDEFIKLHQRVKNEALAQVCHQKSCKHS